METVTLGELLKAMREAGEGGRGFTVSELAEVGELSIERARSLVKRAISDGLVAAAGRKKITDMSGRMMPVPAYVIVKKPGKRRV